MPLIEEVVFFMVWFDPDLPVLRIHLNNTGPTARLTAHHYHALFFGLLSSYSTIDFIASFRRVAALLQWLPMLSSMMDPYRSWPVSGAWMAPKS